MTTMTKEEATKDISAHIIAHYNDEIKGAHEYLAMAKKTMEMDRPDLAEWFHSIAADEYTHAKFMYNYIRENNMPLSEDDCNKLYLLEKKMEEFPG